jgi:hypothetical protein
VGEEGWDMAQVVEYLPSKSKALSSNPSIKKQNKKTNLTVKEIKNFIPFIITKKIKHPVTIQGSERSLE